MTGRINDISRSYFAYVNYWRPSVSLGTSPSQLSTKTLNKWRIVAFATFAITLVTLTIAVYNVVIYQNVPNKLPTATMDITTTTTPTTTTTTPTTTTTTTTTTTSTTTTTPATTAAVTTYISTEVIPTTTAPVTTETVTTTAPERCDLMLPFGAEAGDTVVTDRVFRFMQPFYKFDTKTTPQRGAFQLEYTNSTASIRTQYYGDIKFFAINRRFRASDMTVYFRQVIKQDEKDAVKCLVNDSTDIIDMFVSTWNITSIKENGETPAFQVIVATSSRPGTYGIRIYTETLPEVASTPVALIKDTQDGRILLSDDSLSDIAGKRQIFNFAHAIPENEKLKPVEEVKGCKLFPC